MTSAHATMSLFILLNDLRCIKDEHCTEFDFYGFSNKMYMKRLSKK